MSPNNRIILNIAATYGRTLVSALLGLFVSRWVLMSLGQVDYGLYGVIGGLVVFISLVNGLMALSVQRFYAYAIGSATAAGNDESIEVCRKWFNVALNIHAILPIALLFAGYPIAEWCVKNFLTIPTDRVDACVSVLRFSCVSCFVGMINVPFSAMYCAKQYIAELTLISFIQTIANFFFVYFMVTHPGEWLVGYTAWMVLSQVAVQAIVCIRAMIAFPECKIDFRYWWNMTQMKELGWFAFCYAIGSVGYILRNQGAAILINKVFGPRINAAMGIANNVNGQASSLSSAMQGAFQPAIVSAYGAGNIERMLQLSFMSCKLGGLLALIFVLPLSLELSHIMVLWLKDPPPFAVGLCSCMLWSLVVDKCTIGHMIAVNAKGRIARYQLFVGGAIVLALPLSIIFIYLGMGVMSVGVAFVITMILSSLCRVYFAYQLVGMRVWIWLRSTVIPATLSSVLVVGIFCFGIKQIIPHSILRIGVTSLASVAVLVTIFWYLAFDATEHSFVLQKIFKRKLPYRI